MKRHLHDRQPCSQVDCDNVIEYGDYCEYYDHDYVILCQRCEESLKRAMESWDYSKDEVHHPSQTLSCFV